MGSSSKKVLFLNLKKQESEVKTFPDLKMYIGGVALGLKLYELFSEKDPVIFSVGPLNGFFPYASKTSVVFNASGVVEDLCLGGYLSTRIKFSDLDSIVLLGKSPDDIVVELNNEDASYKNSDTDPDSLGLPGKRSVINVYQKKLVLDEYFSEPEEMLAHKLGKKNFRGLTISGTKTYPPKNLAKYQEVYNSLLEKTSLLSVEKGFFPSCSGCPMGCENSKDGELGGNVLLHSLVACGFAENIYTDVGTIFSCLNVLGYDYTHEDIENLPHLIQNTLRSLS